MEQVDELTVADAMTRGVICVDVEDTVMDVAEIMKKNEISSVLVTEDGDGVGIITERDVICKVVAENANPKRIPAKDVMNSPLITVDPETNIDDAARQMRDKDIRRLVIAKGDKIIGILSEFDIVKIEPAMHTLIQEKIKWELSEQHAASEGIVAGECESCERYTESLRSVDGRFLCENCSPDGID